jgi:hypothetical protein
MRKNGSVATTIYKSKYVSSLTIAIGISCEDLMMMMMAVEVVI